MSNVFSIDYRSLPCGMGQIYDPTQTNKHQDPQTMILVTYDGSDGDPNNPHYGGQIHLKNIWEHPEQIDLLRQFLIDNEVSVVHDGEEGFNHPDISMNGIFDLEDWIKIIKSYC